DTQKQIILEHYENMLDLYGKEIGVKIARKHLGWYSSGRKNSSCFRAAINQETCTKKVSYLIRDFYNIASSSEDQD
ncbi:MAG: hypothetical protein EB127_22210, partial [Alphaproteobacteria bacterium]|nr:hypothetical protein [Alphaproteobacteria bacterium]